MKKIICLVSLLFICGYSGSAQSVKVTSFTPGSVSFPSLLRNGIQTGLSPSMGQHLSDTDFSYTNVNMDRSPQQVLIPPGSHEAFVLCPGTSAVLVVDLDSAVVKNTIQLTSFPANMTMNSQGSKIYVANLSNSVPSFYPADDCGTIGIPISGSPVTVINTQTRSIDTSFMNICCNTQIILNDDETILYVIGCQDFITSYDANTLAHLETFNISTLTGHSTQPESGALADFAHKLFLRSIVFLDSSVQTQVQVLDVAGNTAHSIVYDTLGYSSSDWSGLNPVLLSPDKHDLYLDAGGGTLPPYPNVTLIYDVSTESIKKVAADLSTLGMMIPCSDSTAFFDKGMFKDKKLYNIKTYNTVDDLNIGGCSGVVSADRKTLYLTQIGAHHDEGVTYGSYQNYDITIYDLTSGLYSVVIVSPETFQCSFERMMAMTSDGKFLITTNSALNSVSIMKLPSTVIVPVKSNDQALEVFPNPTTGVFTVSVDGQYAEDVALRVYNSMGTPVYRESGIRMKDKLSRKINLDHQPPGLYYLIIAGSGFHETCKVIQQ